MNSDQYERWLRRNYKIIASPAKRTGHVDLYNPANGRRSQLPRHGGKQQLGKKLMEKIKKDLGIE